MSIPSADELYERYLRHQKGLALLWFWMEQWSGLKSWQWDENILSLNSLVSQRFAVGVRKRKPRHKKNYIFLGIQAEEMSWVKRMVWKRCVWDANTNKLWLVSETIQSPDIDWPDIPSISIGIHIDADKLNGWSGPKIDLRGIWWDEDGVFHVHSNETSSISVKAGTLEQNWTSSERANVKTLKDLVHDKLERSNVLSDPGYAGSAADLSSDQQSLVKPFVDDKKNNYIEKDYPQLFGQFLDTDK